MFGRRSLVVAVALVATSCGSSASTESTTADATTTVPSTTTVPATTTTVYSGPPTLAPGATLPTPEPPPDPNAPDPDIYVGRIEIPAIMLDTTMYQGISEPTLDRGVGWWPGTALPGRVGNVVLAGHRTSHDKPFRYLDVLKPGDEVTLTTSDGTFVYAVTRTEIVQPEDIWIIDQTNASTLTMFACHPLHSVKQRIVVFADYVRRLAA
jgi:sortase A